MEEVRPYRRASEKREKTEKREERQENKRREKEEKNKEKKRKKDEVDRRKRKKRNEESLSLFPSLTLLSFLFLCLSPLGGRPQQTFSYTGFSLDQTKKEVRDALASPASNIKGPKMFSHMMYPGMSPTAFAGPNAEAVQWEEDCPNSL